MDSGSMDWMVMLLVMLLAACEYAQARGNDGCPSFGLTELIMRLLPKGSSKKAQGHREWRLFATAVREQLGFLKLFEHPSGGADMNAHILTAEGRQWLQNRGPLPHLSFNPPLDALKAITPEMKEKKFYQLREMQSPALRIMEQDWIHAPSPAQQAAVAGPIPSSTAQQAVRAGAASSSATIATIFIDASLAAARIREEVEELNKAQATHHMWDGKSETEKAWLALDENLVAENGLSDEVVAPFAYLRPITQKQYDEVCTLIAMPELTSAEGARLRSAILECIVDFPHDLGRKMRHSDDWVVRFNTYKEAMSLPQEGQCAVSPELSALVRAVMPAPELPASYTASQYRGLSVKSTRSKVGQLNGDKAGGSSDDRVLSHLANAAAADPTQVDLRRLAVESKARDKAVAIMKDVEGSRAMALLREAQGMNEAGKRAALDKVVEPIMKTRGLKYGEIKVVLAMIALQKVWFCPAPGPLGTNSNNAEQQQQQAGVGTTSATGVSGVRMATGEAGGNANKKARV